MYFENVINLHEIAMFNIRRKFGDIYNAIKNV